MRLILLIFPMMIIMCGAAAFYSLYVSINILIRKKTVIISARIKHLLFLLISGILFFINIQRLYSIQNNELKYLIPVILFSVLIVIEIYYLIKTGKYYIYGSNNRDLSKAVNYGLKQLDINFNPQKNKLVLPEINNAMKINFNNWSHSGIISLDKFKDKKFFKQFIDKMVFYYDKNASLDRSNGFFFLFFGILSSLFTLFFSYNLFSYL